MTKKRRRKIEQKKITRDCWSLDMAFLGWLSPRLKTYFKDADRVVDLEFHKFTIDGVEKSQREWIKEMIDIVEWLDSGDNCFTEDYAKKLQYLGKIWGNLLPAMWW